MTTFARTRLFLAVAGLTASTALIGAAAPIASAQDAAAGQVRVVHAIQGLVADVYVDGSVALEAFRPRRTTAPLPVPVGDHTIELRKAFSARNSKPLLAAEVTVPEGFVGSLVAHLDAKSQPTLSAFVDDLSPTPPGEARIVVRHTAATAGVDVRLNGDVAIAGLQSGASSATLVAANAYQASVTKSGSDEELLGPQPVEFPDGTANFMYLIGSETDGTLEWIAVQIADLQTAPQAVQTGDGSTRHSSGGGQLQLALLAICVAAVGGVLWRFGLRRTVH